MSDNDKWKSPQVPVFFEELSNEIYYGNFGAAKVSHETLNPKQLPKLTDDNSNSRKRPRKSALDRIMEAPAASGPASASLPRQMVKPDNSPTVPISNAISLDDGLDDFPDKYKLELYRLRARIKNLESDIKDKDQRLLKALAALDDELLFWRTGLNNHVWESMGEITRRVIRLVAAIDYVKDVQPHVWPDLEIPERWRRDTAGEK